MKKLSTVFISLFFLGTAVTAAACSTGSSSKITDTRFKDKRNVGNFTALDIGGAIDVKVYIGSETSVEVIAPDDMTSRIKTEVNNNTLEIGFEGRGNFNGKAQVIIHVPQLVSAEVSGASSLNISNLNNSSFTLDVSGASNVQIEGNTSNLVVDGSGASKMDLSKLSVSTASIDVSGACHGIFSVQSNLVVDASGASVIEYYGKPELKSEVSGASKIRSLND